MDARGWLRVRAPGNNTTLNLHHSTFLREDLNRDEIAALQLKEEVIDYTII